MRGANNCAESKPALGFGTLCSRVNGSAIDVHDELQSLGSDGVGESFIYLFHSFLERSRRECAVEERILSGRKDSSMI